MGVQVSNLTLRVAPALSPGELPPASSWPHSCVLPAYATAAPRAPAGIKIRAAGNIRQYVPDYPRRSADNVVRPILLIGRVNDGFPPRATRAGASPRGAHAPVAAAPLPQGVRQHAWMLQGRTCRFRIGKPCWWVVRGRTKSLCECLERKNPRGFKTRGHSQCLGRSPVADLPWSRPASAVVRLVRAARRFQRTQARDAQQLRHADDLVAGLEVHELGLAGLKRRSVLRRARTIHRT